MRYDKPGDIDYLDYKDHGLVEGDLIDCIFTGPNNDDLPGQVHKVLDKDTLIVICL